METDDSSPSIVEEPGPRPSFRFAVAAVIVVVAMLSVGVIVLELPTPVTMFCALLATIVIGLSLGFGYVDVQDMAFDTVRAALQPIFILIAVGAMIGTWIASGTVPTLVALGLEVLAPSYFLLGTLLFCVVVSVVTGTSWGTMGTLGVALMAVAAGMEIDLAAAAGAIICGSMFGDKMSPLSDSTNLSSAVAETDLMDHIRHMMWTTVPALTITAIIFAILDMSRHTDAGSSQSTDLMASKLGEYFEIGPVTLVPAIVVIVLLAIRKPAFSSISIAALIAVPFAVVLQGSSLSDAMAAMFDGYTMDSGNATLDGLLTAGGMAGMLETVLIMFIAVAMGGILAGTGVLQAILDQFVSVITTNRRLILSTIGVTLLSNAMTGSNSPAHVVSASLMRPLFDRFNLHRKNLSRILEDAATITGPVIPWNTAAVFAAGVLGVSTLTYLPYAYLSFLVPIFSALYGLIGFTIVTADGSRARIAAPADRVRSTKSDADR